MRRRLILRCALGGFALACGSLAVSGSAAGQTPDWSLRRSVTIGSADDPVYALSTVRQVLADADHVYILLPQEGRIKIFTRTGEFVRNLGKRGEGPGELMFPSSMGWYGPRLWVADFQLARFTFFDIETGEANTVPYRVNVPVAYYVYGMAPEAVLANGQLVGYPTVSARARATGLISHRPMIVTEIDGSPRDTLALLSAVNGSVEITTGLQPHARSYIGHPLSDEDMIRFAPDGSGAVLVKRKSWEGKGPAKFEVARVGVHGDTVLYLSIGYDPQRVPSDFFDQEIDTRLDKPTVLDQRAFAGALREFYEQRRYFPPVTSLQVGSDATIWLAGPDNGGERIWLVLDRSGAVIGRFRLPTSSRVSYANRAEAWVVEEDALDIPYVVRYDIVP